MTSDLASSPAAGYVPVGQKPEAVVHAMKVRLCGALRCPGLHLCDRAGHWLFLWKQLNAES